MAKPARPAGKHAHETAREGRGRAGHTQARVMPPRAPWPEEAETWPYVSEGLRTTRLIDVGAPGREILTAVNAARDAATAGLILEAGQMPHDPHYNEARHKAWREKVLRRAGYLCEECKRYGRTDKDGLPVAATTAHHIKHRDEYPELQYDVDNGRALCEACHNRAHPEKGGARGKFWL